MRILLLLVSVFLVTNGAWAAGVNRAALEQFLLEMQTEHGYDPDKARAYFNHVTISPKIISTISRPAESKPWYKYRQIFVTEQRIRGGAKFWRNHAATLAQAERVYGVPGEIIVAIIGVETYYGKQGGSHRVLDALSTLAFNYPRRADFFRSELKHFLLLTRERGVNPLSLHGSYAGAMGMPQFMPSSYRNYAVDFNQDGRIDIWQTPKDSIGSVANYLNAHGWQAGGPIVVSARVAGGQHRNYLDLGLEPQTTWSTLKQSGVAPTREVAGDPLAVLLALETAGGNEYWLGLNNFYVITRYNHSALYAMSVYQLAERIRSDYRRAGR